MAGMPMVVAVLMVLAAAVIFGGDVGGGACAHGATHPSKQPQTNFSHVLTLLPTRDADARWSLDGEV